MAPNRHVQVLELLGDHLFGRPDEIASGAQRVGLVGRRDVLFEDVVVQRVRDEGHKQGGDAGGQPERELQGREREREREGPSWSR